MSTEADLIDNSEINSNETNRKFIKVSFLIFGIGGLLAWNAILSDLGFFEYYIAEYKPSVSFPFLNFVLNIAFQFILLFKKKTMSYRTQLVFTLLLSIASLLILPACILVFPKPIYAFIAAGVDILIQGFINAVCLSSFFGIASYFPVENIIMMSTGQGIAGILMNLIQYVILFTLPVEDEDKEKSEFNRKLGTWIFFGLSAVILLVCCIFVILAYRNKYFKGIMINCGDLDEETKMEIDDLSSIDKRTNKTESVEQDQEQNVAPLLDENKENTNNETVDKGFKYLIYKLKDLNILIFCNYLITFTLYPGACLSAPFFDMDMSFIVNTIVCIFNVSDTIGRKIVSFMKPTKKFLIGLTIARVLFIFTIALNAILNTSSPTSVLICSVCIIFNVILFGFSSGMCTSIIYALAPGEVEDELKGKAGSSISFFNIVGIFGGTSSAFGMSYIITWLSMAKAK